MSHWSYKIFYYTVLSFSLIAFVASFSSILKTGFYQAFDIQDKPMSINLLGSFGGEQKEAKEDKNKDSAKKYIDSTITLVLSTALGVVFTMYLKPTESENHSKKLN